MELGALGLRDGEVFGWMRRITVHDELTHWFDIGAHCTQPLAALDAILMRKDPPVDSEYLYATYMLELAEAAGPLVLNKPQSLRDCNKKQFTDWFPQCTPPTRETRSAAKNQTKQQKHNDNNKKPQHNKNNHASFR